ncbi:alpha/beta fold hydrolase [Duganella aceris]|uniref:alpha/beta fold hydrolase n=1 Tax=Duganella aceris TaxID=2703883 RepID=UPI002803EC66|nr:alpha/beta fold hydrolase [Duganella aceris]
MILSTHVTYARKAVFSSRRPRPDGFLGAAAELIRHPAEKIHFGWPGFGPTPATPDVQGIDDLVNKVIAELDVPCALIAQSMGGIIAIRVALARPDLVTHLVLAETSGGISRGPDGAPR